MKQYKQSDLDEIARESDSFLSAHSGETIFIAGATGFVGSWFLSFFDYANNSLDTRFEVTALARTISNDFRSNFPGVKYLEGEVSNYDFGTNFNPDLIINAATPSVPKRGGEDVIQILRGSIEGTENLLRSCSGEKKPLFINLSSGIVSKRVEELALDLSLPKDAYLHGKRVSESLVSKAAVDGKILGKNMRLYAFVGPGISLTDHFAVGNFLNDAISSRPIHIKGNPSTVRSYLYPTDLVVNVLKETENFTHESFELGSCTRITMQELALIINKATENTGIIQAAEFGAVDEYFPEPDLNMVIQNVGIEESISRWIEWLKL
jgi:nucleoside-diphosphate-sugar epimerase